MFEFLNCYYLALSYICRHNYVIWFMSISSSIRSIYLNLVQTFMRIPWPTNIFVVRIDKIRCGRTLVAFKLQLMIISDPHTFISIAKSMKILLQYVHKLALSRILYTKLLINLDFLGVIISQHWAVRISQREHWDSWKSSHAYSNAVEVYASVVSLAIVFTNT